MKKTIFLVATVLLVALLFAFPVLAVQPTYSSGYWDNYSEDDLTSYYDIHGTWEGSVVQPKKPGRQQIATFIGTVEGIPGKCKFSVVTFGKTFVGSGTVLQCEGELAGLQATFKTSLDDFVNFSGLFESWHHFNP
jgi:hypothetical protein